MPLEFLGRFAREQASPFEVIVFVLAVGTDQPPTIR